jgi:hypothetical protein
MTTTNTSALPAPLTPADCDLRDFQFMPVDVHRLLTSETWILGTGDERAAAMTLWLASWHQVPAGSIPKDDRMLAHLSQSGTKWKKLKPHTLRGWVEAADGRLYHPVVAEKALEAWVEKLAFSLSGSAGNAKRWGVSIETDPIRVRALEAISMLRAIAPQSKTLKKKAVAVIESASRTDSGGDEKTSGGDTARPSGGDTGATRPAIARDKLERDTVDINPYDHTTPAQPELHQVTEPRGVLPSDETTASVGQLCIAMRAYGINADPGNMLMRKLAADGVTVETIKAACEEARRTKPSEAFGPNYVIGIIARWAREAAELKVAGAARPAAGGMPAPAPLRKPQGNEPKGTDESYDEWQARVDAFEAARRRGQAA